MDNGHYISYNKLPSDSPNDSFDSFKNGLGQSNSKSEGKSPEQIFILKNDEKMYKILNHNDKLRGDNRFIYSLFFTQQSF